jgi:IS30 family transposase
MTLAERREIFRLFYIEKMKPAALAAALNRTLPAVTREINRGMDNGIYNPFIAGIRHLEARRNKRPRLKMTSGAWPGIGKATSLSAKAANRRSW